ncbi:MAG: TolC family protein [Phycisphaerae bacterium]|nr:TolC family protein [Phycisphaerae bacterium]
MTQSRFLRISRLSLVLHGALCALIPIFAVHSLVASVSAGEPMQPMTPVANGSSVARSSPPTAAPGAATGQMSPAAAPARTTAAKPLVITASDSQSQAELVADANSEAQPIDATNPNATRDAKPLELKGAAKYALLAMPDTPPVPPQEVLGQLPDPSDAMGVFRARFDALKAVPRQEARVVQTYQNVMRYAEGYLAQLERPLQARLALGDCIARALASSYRIQAESYTPAISQAQLVGAQAAFDAEFFLDASYNQGDRPLTSDIDTGLSDTRVIAGGLRQLLPTGMQVSTQLQQQRLSTDFQFQQINPVYSTNWVTQFTQPLWRGFGLDVNRAQINLRTIEREVAQQRFQQEVRDVLLDVETAYWQLVQARRTAAILAETVAQNRATYESVYNRREHDATEVEIQNAKSSWDQREVQFKEAIRNVLDAEDRLKNLMNDPELLLSKIIEIVPTDTPLVAPIQVDQFAAVRTAIEKREEVAQARGQIEIARINMGVAKNQEMPQLDLQFSYTVAGVGQTADNSFDQFSANRFITYVVGLNFSVPIGNRARRAEVRRSRLVESQAVVRLKQALDTVVEEVNRAVRQLVVRWTQVPAQLDAVRSAERNLRALQARTQKIDPPYLQTELNAVEQLNNTRTTLLQIITEYTTAIVQLERAKGTLVEYNKVNLPDPRSGRL